MARTFNNEKDVKAEVKKLLDKHGWFWWMPPANGYGKSGIADFNAIKNGVFLAVETKFGNNKPSPMQYGWLNSVQAESGFAFVVNEKTLDWLECWMGAFERSAAAVSAQQEVTPEDGALMLDAIRAMTALI